MLELSQTTPVLKTLQEVDQAVQTYLATDLQEPELFNQWQAIREASLELGDTLPNPGVVSEGDRVAGEDSY
ncbi:hypothetical protein ACN4EK_06430 [Pantanalinema rosaneae CENA516]|uniref:hypothetical protein n=1 Tax=Pantanalinema rosaneae TaxID=1620701 RepID=UPI003D6ECA1E